MFEKEEEMISKSKKRLEEMSIPEESVNHAIQHGLLKAKAKRRNRRKSIWTIGVAVILMLTFTTSIRVSPTFATAVASIPGLERFVEILQPEFDKGLEAIIDQEYYEPVGISQTENNITFTLDGVIIDETGAEIFYTLEAPYSIKNIDYGDIKFFNGDKELVSSISYNSPNQEEENRKLDKFSFTFSDIEKFKTKDFKIKFEIMEGRDKTTAFEVPFTIKNDLMSGKEYKVNKEVIIDGQKIFIEEVNIYPLRVALNIHFDEKNTMEILQFEDIRLEDEKGEVWSSIRNGSSGFGGVGDLEKTYFLQSNYFKEPKELYLKFDKVQALPKEESYLLIDFDKKEILEQPSFGKIEITKILPGGLEVRYKPMRDNHTYSLFSQGENEKGEDIYIPLQRSWKDVEYQYEDIQLEGNMFNPVKLPFYAYPNYLKGSASIRIK
ncbi:DUF4179 domain-containing protein [Psychrobacillus sp. MER TA 171]|uniref:DUF4179 domain-containing protein n=1 Tax=Psychrobacillus sp. MER TA 171 TaxID=2939577 RepID=UPI00203C7056|nr:DUF4179 domain-containing protein [Psychrobacillus sp. MER TA 171]MCM3357851.1 DUF4179 domain-containing protein [Psychrobacillus sp. MER TA 171]